MVYIGSANVSLAITEVLITQENQFFGPIIEALSKSNSVNTNISFIRECSLSVPHLTQNAWPGRQEKYLAWLQVKNMLPHSLMALTKDDFQQSFQM